MNSVGMDYVQETRSVLIEIDSVYEMKQGVSQLHSMQIRVDAVQAVIDCCTND